MPECVDGREGECIPAGENGIGGKFLRGGKYVEYDIYGNVFEVTAKYRPPLRPIGRGAYGIVCAAVNIKNNEEIAIKKISRAFDNKIDAKRTLREVKLLRHLKHENIIEIKDIIPPLDRQNFNDVYLVYELMDTDLHQIIRSTQPLTEEHCQYFLYQIFRGLKYVHSANILHRDLKPSNLLVNANCDLKIADFGLARTSSDTDFMTEYVVTRWYRSPELLLNASDYTTAIDVWSVGCIYMELLIREPLLPGRDYVNQLRLITEDCSVGACERNWSAYSLIHTKIRNRLSTAQLERLVFCRANLRLFRNFSSLAGPKQLLGTPDDADLEFVKSESARRYIKQLPDQEKKPLAEKYPSVSPVALDLMEKMLTFNPNKRITVDEALSHPYLANLHDPDDEPMASQAFAFDFDEHSLTEEQIKDLIYEEALELNPELKSTLA